MLNKRNHPKTRPASCKQNSNDCLVYRATHRYMLFPAFPRGGIISFVEVVETNMYILTVDGDESNNSFIPNIEPAFSSQVYLIRVVAAVGCGLACEYFNSRMRMTSTTYRKHPNYMHPSTQELWI